jgi:uncharacterized protein (TIGR03437 family)
MRKDAQLCPVLRVMLCSRWSTPFNPPSDWDRISSRDCRLAGIGGLARMDFQPPAAQPGVPLVLAVYNAASYRPGAAPLVVQRGTEVSAVATVRVVAFAPGLFAAAGDVRGTPWVVHANDFSLVTEQNPAHAGEDLVAFCTGLGATDPAATSGEPATAPAPITASIFAELDTEAVTPVTFAGLMPGWVGLYQIDLRLSASETPGRKQLYFMINYNPTNQAPIWVR